MIVRIRIRMLSRIRIRMYVMQIHNTAINNLKRCKQPYKILHFHVLYCTELVGYWYHPSTASTSTSLTAMMKEISNKDFLNIHVLLGTVLGLSSPPCDRGIACRNISNGVNDKLFYQSYECKWICWRHSLDMLRGH